jgi:hypothetical protein
VSTRQAQCQCGQLSVRTHGEPFRVSVCHCLACQRRSGSVFATQARFRDAQVQIEGEAREWTRQGDEGGIAMFSFCPVCGSTVYYRNQGQPGVIAVAMGAFADPRFPAPAHSVYEARKHAWVTLPGGIEHHD